MQITCYRRRLNAELNCLALLLLQVPGQKRKILSFGKFVKVEKKTGAEGRQCPGVGGQTARLRAPLLGATCRSEPRGRNADLVRCSSS